jgi:ribosomal protein S18 acetylase RimI-like enzyme
MSVTETLLKPASTEDIKTIQALAHKIWTEHYTPIIGDVQVNYMLEKIYSEQALLKQINEGPQQFFLIQNGSEIQGYLSFETENENKGFINKFYLLSETRRSGLGKQVFEALCSIYNSTKEIRLQVNRQNYKAINFYFKMGFVIESCADFDIGDGYFMNDFIMVKHL